MNLLTSFQEPVFCVVQMRVALITRIFLGKLLDSPRLTFHANLLFSFQSTFLTLESVMLSFIFPPTGIGGNGDKVYQCSGCGDLVSYSDRLIRIGTADRHLFVNPAGVECDFFTFSDCPGAIAHGGATAVHTWFPGYRWRMAFCRNCVQHLGWHYEAMSILERPREFWGILVSHLVAR